MMLITRLKLNTPMVKAGYQLTDRPAGLDVMLWLPIVLRDSRGCWSKLFRWRNEHSKVLQSVLDSLTPVAANRVYDAIHAAKGQPIHTTITSLHIESETQLDTAAIARASEGLRDLLCDWIAPRVCVAFAMEWEYQDLPSAASGVVMRLQVKRGQSQG